MAIDYLKLFGDDFDTVLNALDDLTPAAERVLLNSLDNMVFDAQTFSTNIQKQISTMTSSGMSRGAIASSLNNDMKTGGRIFGQLKNNIKSGVVEGVQETAKLGQYDNYDLDKGNFAWVTVGGHKVCADCDGRAGDVGTFNYHETEGLPGAGWSVCQAYCYCVLDPTGKLPKKVQGVPVREKRAGVPQPPKWKPTMTTKEASRWASKSKVEGIVYHGASSEALAGIGKTGFDFNIRSTGRLYGDGAYFTRNTVVANGYGDGVMGTFMVNSKAHRVLSSDEYWGMFNFEVSSASELTSGHTFLNKVRMGAVDDIAEMHAKKYKFENPATGLAYTPEELLAVRLEGLADEFNTPTSRYVDNYRGSLDSDLTGKWANYLESEYYAGNANVRAMMEKYAEVGNLDDLMFMEETGPVLKEFFSKELGLTSLEIDGAILPQAIGELTTDNYFIVFDPKNITKIMD